MLTDLSTPAFVVDRAIVERNCARMREKARASGIAFRPHVKTHKTVEIGRMQHGGGVGAITVSTLAEAEFFANDGFRDITYAVPIAPEKLPRVASLAAQIDRLSVLVDSDDAVRALEAFAAAHDVTFDAFLKIDCGYHRAGVDPQSPDSVRLAMRLARSERVRFQGLLTHAGHSYNARDVDEIRRIAAQEAGSLTRFRALLASEGFTDARRSIGSTPTAAIVDRFTGCDEVRPGNYAARRGGKKSGAPDRQPVLLDAWRRAIDDHGGGVAVFVGGKSLGGRMASMVADETNVRGLICFGYPFHPPGKPERTRTEHLGDLRTPTLILQGTRDPFGAPDDVSAYVLSKAIRIEWMQGGDHSLKGNVPRAADLAATFVLRE